MDSTHLKNNDVDSCVGAESQTNADNDLSNNFQCDVKKKSNEELVKEVLRQNFDSVNLDDSDSDKFSSNDPEEDSAESRKESSQEIIDDEKDSAQGKQKECPEDETFLKKIEDQLSSDELTERFNASKKLKDEGNAFFKSEEFTEAISKYTESLKLCPTKHTTNRAVMWANRGACHMAMLEYDSAISDSTKALAQDPGYVKALLRRAKCYEKRDKLDEALEDYKKILELDPSVHEARTACMRLPEEINVRNERLKTEMMGKLKDLGNLVLRPFGLSTDNFQVTQDPTSGGYSINFQQQPPPRPQNGK